MNFSDLQFDISDEVLSLGLTGVYFTIGGLKNTKSSPEFDQLIERTEKEILAGLSKDLIKQDPILLGFRKLHETVGRSNRKNVAAPENLLAALLQTGHIPRVNLLVDIYNLVSIRSRLALGAHDIARIAGNVHLRMTTGSESFVPLGAPEAKPIAAGEYAYIDDGNEVLCRLEVRQVEKTKVTLETTECFYVVQGNSATSEAVLMTAVGELITLTKKFCGGIERLIYPPESDE
jgi:DNA/RNA-binding domain of Phe-tRNA-synthetase-like protein